MIRIIQAERGRLGSVDRKNRSRLVRLEALRARGKVRAHVRLLLQSKRADILSGRQLAILFGRDRLRHLAQSRKSLLSRHSSTTTSRASLVFFYTCLLIDVTLCCSVYCRNFDADSF